jgi:uncharacterized protein YutE (UPF0331/DUF86 family)
MDSKQNIPDREAMRQQMQTALDAIHTIAETIRELGEVPSGELYARLMGKIELGDYDLILDTLKRAGLVTESPAHLLKWNRIER